jgi:CTP synthase
MDSETLYPVIDLMEGQKQIVDKGGTMRLGAYECDLREGTLAQKVYGRKKISERHRHRFEFNNEYRELFESKGMIPSGINEKSDLVEIVELADHPFFMGVQFHPEYKSTVANPHPAFVGFINAVVDNSKK